MYLPADQKTLIREFYQKYQPKLLLLMETELWPNLLDQAPQFNVPTVLLNARLSEKSAKGYTKVKGLTRGMLQQLTQLLAQDIATQQRYIQLGIAAEKTQVLGNIKFDITAPERFIQQADQLTPEWQLGGRKSVTLASTKTMLLKRKRNSECFKSCFRSSSIFGLYCGTARSGTF